MEGRCVLGGSQREQDTKPPCGQPGGLNSGNLISEENALICSGLCRLECVLGHPKPIFAALSTLVSEMLSLWT